MSLPPPSERRLHDLIPTEDPLVVCTHLACSTTNLKANSLCQVRVGCDVMWSLAQQFACMRLIGSNTHQVKNREAHFDDYAKVARCIAATYARFYLETEANGDKALKGRYYWMALAAFASKTVACNMESANMKLAQNMPSEALQQVKTHLAKGNIWLFQDIAPTHWFHSHYHDDCFDQCLSTRGKGSYLLPVEHNLYSLPWGKEAVAVTDYFKITPQIKKAFDLTKKITIEKNKKTKENLQLEHLQLVAIHEQQLLQKLIYNNKQFTSALSWQRNTPWFIDPAVRVVFNSTCSTEFSNHESVAPDGIVLENYKARMDWINDAAKDFHKQMIDEPRRMDKELSIIASGYIPIGERRRT